MVVQRTVENGVNGCRVWMHFALGGKTNVG
jgi:hypothetical protein